MQSRAGLAIALVFVTSVAHADDAATLVAQGEELARRGEFSRAIQAFKQADALAPSAANACRIGLAYTRRELWSQAEIFFQRCRADATTASPVPTWLDAAEHQLAQKLVAVDAAPIEVQVDPPGASIAVSSFPPDETFRPQTLHLSPGSYQIGATAPGRLRATATITVTSSARQIVTLVLPLPPPPPPPPPRPLTRVQRIGTAMLFGAGGAAALGLAFHAYAAFVRRDLSDAHDGNDPVAWDRAASTFETTRALAIGSYGLAVIATGVGLYLRTRGPEPHANVVAGASSSGAFVGVEWRR